MFQEFWSRFSKSPEKPPLITKPLLALILEPDAVTFSLLADALKGEGFRVLQIRTASEAAVHVRREPIDLVFLNGEHSPSTLQTIEQMRRLAGPDSLTIIVAADPAVPGSAPELIAAGADDCLHQPLALSEVRNRVRARLRARGRRSFRDEPTPVEPGLVLDGKFRLVEELGRGNFGTVYSAVHLNLERQVAIKILHDKFSGRGEVERRLRLEGVSACQIEHANAVKVFDLSLTRDGVPFLVMELLQGQSLEAELADAPDERLSARRAAEILIPVCQVLAESHRVGMLHLDIKPGNIFLHRQADRSVVKVLDFGIVKMVSTDQEPGTPIEVQTRSFEGTPNYASLERLLGEPFGPKADIYSVGVVLYQMLTGRLPYEGSRTPLHLISLVMDGKYPLPTSLVPDLPAELVELCIRCLNSEPKHRPTAEELAQLLMPWASGS